MQNKTSMETVICQAENGFSFDELVIKLSYGWSDKGATTIARIILKRFTSTSEWERYWQDNMNFLGNVIVSVRNYKGFSQNLGH